jgi:hypothetical protein
VSHLPGKGDGPKPPTWPLSPPVAPPGNEQAAAPQPPQELTDEHPDGPLDVAIHASAWIAKSDGHELVESLAMSALPS